jgi:hypothetical protein
MKKDFKNLPKLSTEELKKIRLSNGEIRTVEKRDLSVWTKSFQEKRTIKEVKSDHNALLKSQGINPKRNINDKNLTEMC